MKQCLFFSHQKYIFFTKHFLSELSKVLKYKTKWFLMMETFSTPQDCEKLHFQLRNFSTHQHKFTWCKNSNHLILNTGAWKKEKKITDSSPQVDVELNQKPERASDTNHHRHDLPSKPWTPLYVMAIGVMAGIRRWDP